MTHIRANSIREAWPAILTTGGIVVGVFVLFGIAYWLQVRPRLLEMPQRYHQRAQALLRANPPDPRGAALELERGMDHYLPTSHGVDGPHALLARAYRMLEQETRAALVEQRAAFQHQLRRDLEAGTADLVAWQRAAEAALPLLGLTQADTGGLGPPFDAAWALFVRQFTVNDDVRRSLLAMPTLVRLALLDLAGWRVAAQGRVGATPTRVDRALLVVSAGHHTRHEDRARVGGVVLLGLGDRLYRLNQRGLWIVDLTPDNMSSAYDMQGFDLFDAPDPQAINDELLMALRAVHTGRLAVVAVCDEAGRNLDQAAWLRQLRDFGHDIPVSAEPEQPYLGFRQSFASVGVRGAALGSGLHVHGRAGEWPMGILILPPRPR